YPPLPGARKEAEAVRAALCQQGWLRQQQVAVLNSQDGGDNNGPTARAVVNAVMKRDWRVVHIAGHGEPPEQRADADAECQRRNGRALNPRGVVLSDGVYLGPREIQSMRRVPELVFVNCCHLGASPKEELLTKEWRDRERLRRDDRPGFA